MTTPLFLDRLASFLVEAKRRTYAAGDAARVAPLIPGSVQLEYREGPLLYRDVYFGSTWFTGQETVYHEGIPVWAMGYQGRILTAGVVPADVYGFLRRALLQVAPECPYRGPAEHVEQPFRYLNHIRGNVQRFRGTETVLLNEQPVYELEYRGGLLRQGGRSSAGQGAGWGRLPALVTDAGGQHPVAPSGRVTMPPGFRW